jgi:hypothetical protein
VLSLGDPLHQRSVRNLHGTADRATSFTAQNSLDCSVEGVVGEAQGPLGRELASGSWIIAVLRRRFAGEPSFSTYNNEGFSGYRDAVLFSH